MKETFVSSDLDLFLLALRRVQLILWTRAFWMNFWWSFLIPSLRFLTKEVVCLQFPYNCITWRFACPDSNKDSLSALCGHHWGWIAIRSSGVTCATCGGLFSFIVCFLFLTKRSRKKTSISSILSIENALYFSWDLSDSFNFRNSLRRWYDNSHTD